MAKFNVKTEKKFDPITVEITVEDETEAIALLDVLNTNFTNNAVRIFGGGDSYIESGDIFRKVRAILQERGVIKT